MHLYLSYFLALFIGISLGLTGGGGSILTVPVLVYAAKIEPVTATAYSLFIVGFTSLAGALVYLKKGLVNLRMAFIFALPSLLTVWLIRKFLIHNLPDVLWQNSLFTLGKDWFLMLFFAVVMAVAAYKMINDDAVEVSSPTTETKHLKVFLSGIGVGILSGLVGAGGGFLIVPALVFLMRLPMYKAVATSLVVIALNSLIGFTGDMLSFTGINWTFLLPFAGIATVGVFLGIYLNRFINQHKLKIGFGYFVLLMAAVVFFGEI